MARKKDDWHPFYASATVIAALQRGGIKPAHCWIASASLTDGRHSPECKIVAIWDGDMSAFNRAVRRGDRTAVTMMSHTGLRDLPDLAALAREVTKVAR
jgi:hypothetical protein